MAFSAKLQAKYGSRCLCWGQFVPGAAGGEQTPRVAESERIEPCERG